MRSQICKWSVTLPQKERLYATHPASSVNTFFNLAPTLDLLSSMFKKPKKNQNTHTSKKKKDKEQTYFLSRKPQTFPASFSGWSHQFPPPSNTTQQLHHKKKNTNSTHPLCFLGKKRKKKNHIFFLTSCFLSCCQVPNKACTFIYMASKKGQF